MEDRVLDIKIVEYAEYSLGSGCVTGGGGCSCDDGTSE